MLVREEKSPRKFYYTVSEDCQGIGRMGWGNMVRDIQSKHRKSHPSYKKQLKQIAPDPTFSGKNLDSQLAKEVHITIKRLNVAIKNACDQNLTVELEVINQEGSCPHVQDRVFKEF
jgi:hypothetical protein